MPEETVYITGIGGMIGSYLTEELQESHRVIGSYYNPTIPLSDLRLNGNSSILESDVRYLPNELKTIREYRPSVIFHLAAQSYPAVSWEKPHETMETNVGGTINIFESVLETRRQYPDYDPMVVVACSSAEYGDSLLRLAGGGGGISEDTALLPLHPYGVSKVAQDLLAYQYFVNNRIRTIRARIFNTTGPRKVGDVCADFTRRAILIEKGLTPPYMHVGNLETERAITDVRDLTHALILLSELGIPGEVYNISGDHVYRIRNIVSIIRENLNSDFTTEVDQKLLRPVDEKVIVGNSDKLIRDTGWKQRYTLQQTIADMLEYWRSHL